MRGLVKDDPHKVHERALKLLREGPDRMVQLENLAFRALDSILDRSDANWSDGAVVYGGAQFLDSAAATRELITRGYIRGALFHLRSMIETFAVLEYLHGDEERSRLWSRADAPKERLEFTFEKVYRHTPRGEVWHSLWETYKDKTHANHGSFVAQSRLRAKAGGDTWVGPFYEPDSITRFFLIALAMTEWFARQLEEWCEADGILPADFGRAWEAISGYEKYSKGLEKRASREAARTVAKYEGSLSLADQEKAHQAFNDLARRLGEEPLEPNR
jgi:hypothetical protein